jgi:hypothetical protein
VAFPAPRIWLSAALTAFATVSAVSLVAIVGNWVYFTVRPAEEFAISELQMQGDSVKRALSDTMNETLMINVLVAVVALILAVADHRRTRPPLRTLTVLSVLLLIPASMVAFVATSAISIAVNGGSFSLS